MSFSVEEKREVRDHPLTSVIRTIRLYPGGFALHCGQEVKQDIKNSVSVSKGSQIYARSPTWKSLFLKSRLLLEEKQFHPINHCAIYP